jgi:hypothetical protein
MITVDLPPPRVASQTGKQLRDLRAPGDLPAGESWQIRIPDQASPAPRQLSIEWTARL